MGVTVDSKSSNYMYGVHLSKNNLLWHLFRILCHHTEASVCFTFRVSTLNTINKPIFY